jgi:23S rRNA (adenine2503-C2)-methyltransferase
MLNLIALDLDGLRELMRSWGQPAFRASQLHEWLYSRGAASFEEMHNLPLALRERLEAECSLGSLRLDTEQQSSDGTLKRLYRLADSQLIEAVLMPYGSGRRTACISSQAGCAMGCVFCATGQMGFVRQLRADEIFEQAYLYSRELQARGERLSNVVLMGMGEPFHNYGPVLEAVERIMSELGIGARHITISTVGLVKRIRDFADHGTQITLAISLHAATDEARSAILPINRRHDLAELIEACHYYVDKSNRRITFEWALIDGENDSTEEAARLGALLEGLHCHVNLIPLNPTQGFSGGPSSADRADAFVATLARHGIPATVRVRRGLDIDAGCGQLKSQVMDRSSGSS